MSRRIQRSPVYLHPERSKQLPYSEIKMILRGADELIMRGGRSLLARLLKGSREKSVLEHELDRSPVYGHFHDLTIDEITSKIDWLIDHRYLDYEYSGKLPLLCYSPLGWEIERETYAEELFDKLCLMASNSEREFDMTFLKDRNREMILLLLDKIEQRADASFLPLLESWKDIDYRKVRQRINAVMKTIASGANPTNPIIHQSMSSIILSIDIAHPPRRPDVVESELQEAVSKVRNSSSLRVLKIIHGHGSTGKGGSSKDIVRNWAFRNRTRFKAIIDGEDFDLFDPETQRMRSEVGQFADVDLGSANRGITIIWVK